MSALDKDVFPFMSHGGPDRAGSQCKHYRQRQEMTTGPRSEIDWNDDGVPLSRRFEDPYYSLQNGLAETRHVFLGGNDLPERFRPGFHIAELGFGTGLNLIAAVIAWRQSGAAGKLRFTSFEAYPLQADEMDAALAAFPEAHAAARPLLDAWGQGRAHIATDDLEAEIIFGDARSRLPLWKGKADAWFLDGFAPARNPELWEPDLMREVALHTNPGGSFATYTAAGGVRRALAQAGFAVERVPGFGHKRHMSIGRLS
jgi:tRNA U34 5-methylaminomethyl-2-thiouridine-forming methyltransferase MnmC